MPSQFFGLNIAASGLKAANAALLTTGNNTSNVNTEGYSRQKVKSEAADALRVFSKYGCAGAGVETLSIERVRDAFYDARYRENETHLGKYERRDYYNLMIESYFEEDGVTGTGFTSLFDRVNSSLQTIMTTGTDDAKTSYLGNMKSLTEYFNNNAGNLKQLQESVNSEVKLIADQVNAIAEKISILNKQINTIELTGAMANELRDKRDMLLDELSSYVSVEIKETKVIDKSDPDRDTGISRLTVHIAGGQLLIDDSEYNQLICVARSPEDRINQTDIDGLYDLKWASSTYRDGDAFKGTFDLGNALIGGKLKGLLDIRDGNNAQYFNGNSDGTVDEGNVSGPDPATGMMSGTVKLTVSKDSLPFYLQDMSKSNVYDTSTIKIGSRYYNYDGWTYNDDGSYSFNVKIDKLTEGDYNVLTSEMRSAATVKIGEAVDYQGIPYYMGQMNEWIRNYAEEVNAIMTSGYTSDSRDGIYMLTGRMTTDSAAQYSFEHLTTNNRKYSYLTADNFCVNEDLLKEVSLLATKTDKTEGNEEMRNLEKLQEMTSKKNIFRNATSGDFLAKVLSDISLNRNNSSTLLTTYSDLQLTIDNQRQSVMGVDKDEEAMDLVKYQNMYTLNSKMIQTLSEIYDRLILQTGV